MNQISNDKQLYILWLASWYPHEENPFIGDFILRHAEAASRFCKIVVLFAVEKQGASFEAEWGNPQPGMFELRMLVPPTGNFPGASFIKFLKYFRAWLKGYLLLQKRFSKPDLVHLHVIYPAGIFALLISRFEKIPLLVSEHWSGYFPQSGHFKGFFMKWQALQVVRRAKAILTISQALQHAMKKHGLTGDFMIVPNVVNTETPRLPRSKNGENKCHFIHASSLQESSKNISGMLRAVKKLADKRDDFSFTIVGGIPDENRYFFEKQTESLCLKHIVHFTGALPHTAVFEQMREADVFVLFSNYEGGLPCVLAEAMSVGLPVIATKIEGLAEWINEDVGLLVGIGDEAGLLSALDWMIENHTRFDPEKIRQSMIETSSYPVIGKKLLTIYEEVLGVKHQPAASS